MKKTRATLSNRAQHHHVHRSALGLSFAVLATSWPALAQTTHNHILAISSDQTALYHSHGINGSWNGFQRVEVGSGSVDRVTSFVDNNFDLVTVVLMGGRLKTTIRRATTNSWTPVEIPKNFDSAYFTEPSLARGTVSHGAVLCSVVGGNVAYFTRDSRGNWSEYMGWQQSSYAPCSFDEVACAYVRTRYPGSLQEKDVLHIVAKGTDGMLYHTQEYPDGTWQHQWGNLTNAARPACKIRDLSATAAGFDLHVVGTGNNCQEHTIRYGNGAWQRFASIASAANDPGYELYGSAVYDGLQLRVVSGVSTMYSTSDVGHIWETKRSNSGSWTPIVDLNAATGSPGRLGRVSVAAYTYFPYEPPPIIQ